MLSAIISNNKYCKWNNFLFMVQKFELVQVFLILQFFFCCIFSKIEKKKENYFFHANNFLNVDSAGLPNGILGPPPNETACFQVW